MWIQSLGGRNVAAEESFKAANGLFFNFNIMYRESSDDAGYVLKSEHWTKRSSKKLKMLQSNDNNER